MQLTTTLKQVKQIRNYKENLKNPVSTETSVQLSWSLIEAGRKITKQDTDDLRRY